MAFRVGQKVVCVDASPSLRGEPCPLSKDAVYTIATVKRRSVLLIEVETPRSYPGFRSERFRPAVEGKTDISIFTKMLTPNKVTERV